MTDTDDDERLFIEPFDQLATSLLHQVGLSGEPLFIRERVDALAEALNAELASDEPRYQPDIALLAVIGVMGEHLRAGSPLTQGVAQLQLLGKRQVNGCDLVWEACLKPTQRRRA